MVQVLLFAIHFCLVTNKQFCVNNFWSEIVFIYTHTYIKCFHKLYMYTERKKKKGKAIIPTKHHQPHWNLSDNTDSSAAGNEKSRQEEKQRNLKSYLTSHWQQ